MQDSLVVGMGWYWPTAQGRHANLPVGASPSAAARGHVTSAVPPSAGGDGMGLNGWNGYMTARGGQKRTHDRWKRLYSCS